MRYFLIDKVTELTPGERAAGIKNVTLSDEILHDHFPDYPIMPGALIVEAIAQLAGFLLEVSFQPTEGPVLRAMLVQIQKAKFHRVAGPGDQLQIDAAITSRLEGFVQVRGRVTVAGQRTARADLTFSLRPVESERLNAQRRNLYALWTRDLPNPPAIP